jgi:hypothetical protein
MRHGIGKINSTVQKVGSSTFGRGFLLPHFINLTQTLPYLTQEKVRSRILDQPQNPARDIRLILNWGCPWRIIGFEPTTIC